MRAHFKWWVVRALALLLAASAASAQDRVPFRQEELDQMLAPVALYPDSLLSQVLMASTYPLEVVQAARWSRANPGLSGQDAVRAVERMDWDPSVKSLTAFPQVLHRMDEKLEWTERLGEAFLAQQADVMDTIQGLRRRAEAAGNLGTDDRMRVARQDGVIAIEPPAPGVLYVPYYNPLVVYGPWWWPLYPPVFWAPPPTYVVAPYRPAFAWGSGIVISAGFFFGHFDWPHRHVKVVHVVHHRPDARPVHVHSDWRHDPAHRRGVPFRHAGVRPRVEQPRSGGEPHRNGFAQAERRGLDRTAESRQRRWEERGMATAPAERNLQAGRIPLPANDLRRESGAAPRPQARGPETRSAVAPSPRSGPRPAAATGVQVEPRKALQIAPRQAPQSAPRVEARVIGRPGHAAPPQQRPVAREVPAAPRAAVAAPRPAPRMEAPRERGTQTRSNPGRGRPAGRDGQRKS
jgi:hypothetical protein